MPATPIFGLRSPAASDPPDGPTQIGNLATDVEDQLAAGIRSAGKSIIAAEQTTASSTYTLMGTPDRVQNIVLPADGLIFVTYEAEVASGSVGSIASAGLFLNDTQVMSVASSAIPVEATWNDTNYGRLFTGLADLVFFSTALPSDPVALYPPISIRAAAGTHSVSIRFKGASAVVGAKNRKLRVWSQSFDGLPA